MIHHRKRTKFAFLLSMLGIAVLAVAMNAFLQQKKDTTQNVEVLAEAPSQQSPVSSNSTSVAASISPSNTVAAPKEAVSNTPSEAESSTPTVAGTDVLFPEGPKLTVPMPWVYSYTTENGATVLNFGTQQFSESNPYSPSQKADASGYFGPESIAPSEAIGPQNREQKVTTASGGEVVIRAFSADVDGTILDQLVAMIPFDGKTYSAIFYTTADNTDQISRFIQLIETITKP